VRTTKWGGCVANGGVGRSCGAGRGKKKKKKKERTAAQAKESKGGLKIDNGHEKKGSGRGGGRGKA